MTNELYMKRILIVEDEIVIALDLKMSLQSNGHKVLDIVSTGEAAVRRARDLKPDVILMDINLKGNINGIEAAKAILEEDPDENIIFVSAFENRWFSEPSVINNSTFFNKPINFFQLIEKINSLN